MPVLAHRIAVTIAALALLLVGVTPVAAAEEVVIEATVLLDGHARLGSWMAIRVDVSNAGPPISGELRLSAGTQTRTRYSTPADLPTGSSKRFFLYAQPPSFGETLDVTLVEGDRTVATVEARFAVHQANQLVVAVVAERPQGILGSLDLEADQNGQPPVTFAIEPDQLPERVEAWSAVDRLVWQDVDSNTLSSAQLDALRGWLAGGGRLVIAGGTAGPGVLSAFPDAILPYRPAALVDQAPQSLAGLLGELPEGARDLPALSGELIRGRALAMSGDVVTAAEASYGVGSVTLLGFDPATPWIAESRTGAALWKRLLPPRASTPMSIGDDSQLMSAVSNLPALALPPIGGLVILLVGYIILIGPVNYLVLRRLDRREWAWFTMPALIVVFAVGSYGFGAALRGSDIIVNEVAIVRGAPDTTEGQAQVYLGVFSPTRATYQLRVPGGALLSPPISTEIFGAPEASAGLDIVQGDPARVRGLAVGFGTLRAIRAEAQVSAPRVIADVRVEGDRLVGTLRNASEITLEKPAIVLGRNILVLRDLAPGAQTDLDLRLAQNPFGQSMSDRILGQAFFLNPGTADESQQSSLIRHQILDQLTWDPNWGGPSGQLPADGPVLLAWGTGTVIPLEIEGQGARRIGNVLYYVPLPLAVAGEVVFRSDLVRSTVVEADAVFFGKGGPFDLNFSKGSVTMSYRPIVFEGSLRATRLLYGTNFGGDIQPGGAVTITPEPIRECPAGEDCLLPGPIIDGLPDIEIFDRAAGRWMSLGHPESGRTYEVVDPARYVDPGTGSALFRFVSDQEGVTFQFGVQIEGVVG